MKLKQILFFYAYLFYPTSQRSHHKFSYGYISGQVVKAEEAIFNLLLQEMHIGGCTFRNGLNFTKSNFASPFGFFHLAFGILLFDCLNDFDVRRVDFRRLVYFRAFLDIFILYPLTAEKTITYEHSESLIYLVTILCLDQIDIRGVSGGGGGWAFAYPGFGRIEDATGQRRCSAACYLPTKIQMASYAP